MRPFLFFRKIYVIVAAALYTALAAVALVLRQKIKPDPQLSSRMAKNWAQTMLDLVGVKITVEGETPSKDPCLFVGNHVSYLDIIVLMSLYPVRFVAKAEIRGWPIFGFAAHVAGTVFVDRSSTSSRSSTAAAIAHGVTVEKKQVAIFPEGTSTLLGKPWKKGSFQIAQHNNFPVQPFCLLFSPLRACAYIDDDLLVPHLWNLLNEKSIEVKLVFAKSRLVTEATADALELQTWSQNLVKNHADQHR